MPGPPTDRQREVLDCIRAHFLRHGRPPTLQEIAEEFGFASDRAVRDHLTALHKKGFLTYTPGVKRGIRLAIPLDPLAARLPLFGAVTAGVPTETFQENEESVVVDRRLLKNPDHLFVLRVLGNSMVGAGIHDGDYVIMRRGATAEHRQIVAVLIDGETTIKRLLLFDKKIVLHPENPEYPDIEIQPDQRFAVQGVFAGLLRVSDDAPH